MTALLALAAAAASEADLVRQDNKDAAYAGRWLFAVADGLGGHAAGEVASAAVIQALRPHDAEVPQGALLEVLGRAVAEANREVARRADGDLARRGMGTTLTAMLFSGDRAALVHIGDSRAFRLRDGRLRQITEDHTIGNLVWDAGFLAPVLERYLDGRPDRSADLGVRDLRVGDRTAGPATSTPSGNCPPWPPNGTAPTAAAAPTSPGHWSSTTAGCPAPCAASPASPVNACRTA